MGSKLALLIHAQVVQVVSPRASHASPESSLKQKINTIELKCTKNEESIN